VGEFWNKLQGFKFCHPRAPLATMVKGLIFNIKRMLMPFTKDTFKYLELARKNQMKEAWFDKNEELYLQSVRRPMSDLVVKIWERFDDELPRIKIDPKKVTRPKKTKKKDRPGEPIIKSETSFFFTESATSRFEWNPGIYFQLGHEKDDNLLGIGLYMVSSRQMKKMRSAIAGNFEEFDAIMSNKALKKAFGDFSGEVYTRFPKEFDEQAPYAKYLKHKQFFLARHYTRAEVMKKNFHSVVLKDLETVMPFFLWVREKVGVYQR
jgi:uncharacterized protein (TIGR02453 family)